MVPIVIYNLNHVNLIVSEFKFYQQGLNEFIYPGHKGLTKNFHLKFVHSRLLPAGPHFL